MRRRRNLKGGSDTHFPLSVDQLEDIIKSKLAGNADLIFSKYEHKEQKLAIFYISYLIDTEKLENSLLSPLLNSQDKWTNQAILNEIPLGESATTSNIQEVVDKLLIGCVYIYIEQEKEIVSYQLTKMEQRSLDKAETESVVLGPKFAFTESLTANLNVLRGIIKSPDLVLEKVMVGNSIPSEVRLVYLKSIANETDVNTMRQRLLDLDVDEIQDSTVLKQYIEDSSMNLFPQFYTTELPDRFSYTVKKGKIGVLVENSPTGFIAPSTLFSFFESTEDIYMRWDAGSFLRALRFLAMFIAIIVTPVYVAIVTYQYELIPTKLLVSIGQSRAAVPFPPLIEALLIELFIELLREAGARLPTKVGQTMGIVGGIVIGTAAVQAGLTSNILIIVVALSALASFTTPNYLMGTTLRVIRFPMIGLAGLYGMVGIMFGIILLLIHLLHLTSLGRPYLAPLYPLKLQDFNKVFYRLPFNMQNKRAKFIRPKDLIRYSESEAKKKHDIDK